MHIIKYNTSDCKSGKETLCIHSFHNVLARSIASAIACGALLYQPYCKCPKFSPKIGRARSWPSRRPAALYECFFEQWARIFGRVMTRPTRPVPPGLDFRKGGASSRTARAKCAGNLVNRKPHLLINAEFGTEVNNTKLRWLERCIIYTLTKTI